MSTLTYLQVHIYFNIPPLILFWYLYKPLSSKGDLRKYLFLVVIAVLYTTPWDNYIIWRKAWQYCPTCVMGTIGLVPVEEYVFFVTQTLLTCLFHSLITKCFAGLPALGIRSGRLRNGLYLLFLVSLGAVQCILSWSNPKSFYMRAILLWTTPVLVFLFAISGIMTSFLYHRLSTTLLSIAVPTVYLCLIDSAAIRSGTWHINEATSLECFVWAGLPLEESVFFLVTNTMVVLGASGFDLAFSIVHTYDQTLDFSFGSLCRALLLKRDEQVVDDLAECVRVLKRGSSSFYTSSFFFNESVRRDLVVLYAFCRYTDDITDDTKIDARIRAARLEKLRIFVKANFMPKVALKHANRLSEEKIKQNDDPIQRSMLRFIAHRVPREPLLELLEGYDWDLHLDTSDHRRIRVEEELLAYAKHVASSVAEMCMYVVDPNPQETIVLSAREMGVVLQLTNVARDILTDAMYGRVYVPESWFKDSERQELLEAGQLALAQHNVSALSRQHRAGQHALRLLAMADEMHKRSTVAIDSLPEDAQIGIRIATDGYFAIGKHLESICKTGPYPIRARLPKRTRILLVLQKLYTPGKAEALLLGGCLLRLLLLFYGHWQDNLGGNVRYTDIDYTVFTDAARFMQAGGSPYERATYRYTPLLAWLLIPNQYFAPWGKLLFAGGDMLTGWLMITLLRKRKDSINWSAIWLLNPMVAVISTRGNSEGLLGALVIALLYAVESGQTVVAGLLLGTAIHFKIYPLIYAPSLVWFMKTRSKSGTDSLPPLLDLFNKQRITLAVSSVSAFTILSAYMFHLYGMEFLQHTFLYHISRSDHRHNFSPYHLLLYLSSASKSSGSTGVALLAFLPQMSLSLVILPLALARRDLTACFFAQTFAFVAFNKVVTSQYFMWYLVFLPLYLPRSTFLSRSGIISLVAWIVGQAVWLYYAYGFEILGENTFIEMWLATLLFFIVNMYILGKIVQA